VIGGSFLGILISLSILGFQPDDFASIADALNLRNYNDDSPGLEINATAPGFSLFSTGGNHVELSEIVGTPVIINFWATWCTPCLVEMPMLQKRFDSYQPDLYVLAVNSGESKTIVNKYIEENDLTIPALLDPTRSVVKMYNVRAYPTTYFIDRQGIIQAIYVGVLSEKLLDRYLSKIGVFDG
jgi:peroxiredoxin